MEKAANAIFNDNDKQQGVQQISLFHLSIFPVTCLSFSPFKIKLSARSIISHIEFSHSKFEIFVMYLDMVCRDSRQMREVAKARR